jgi:signal transduction histidine kinase
VSFTGKIRLFLIMIAVVPPLTIMAVIYFHSAQQVEKIERESAVDEIRKYYHFRQTFVDELRETVKAVTAMPSFTKDLMVISSGRTRMTSLTADMSWLDFVELVDSTNTVVASYKRPAMVGEKLARLENRLAEDTLPYLEATEFDLNGRHAAMVILHPAGNGYRVYCGCYLDANFIRAARSAMNGELHLQFVDENKGMDYLHSVMEPGVVYGTDSGYEAVLNRGPDAGFYISATFAGGTQRPLFISIIKVTGIVAVVSTLLAIALGWFMSSRAKREIDNLIQATAKVAAGDLNSPVMAYEDGEFAQLADAFSEMTLQLKTAQQKLAVSQKVAAWQVMGRKIAHEVKNPLTPIAICADDLRRSYHEKLPDFEGTLDKNTIMIKSEVHRLAKLLDHFVGFARMAPSVKEATKLDDIVNDLRTLYGAEIGAGRLEIDDQAARRIYPLDYGQIKQVLINLIKNGFESRVESRVKVSLGEEREGLAIVVSDSGPGFPTESLERGFEPYLSSKRDGSGLGLVICQRIVSDHGGTIVLGNRPEGGAQVSIWIPGE